MSQEGWYRRGCGVQNQGTAYYFTIINLWTKWLVWITIIRTHTTWKSLLLNEKTRFGFETPF